mmetsp:Transcript_101614/g.270246  ORF Transcript_101614/g.270246 Transcript_101614/m.270246 type:complete len:231 (+) Transcript_101614:38-730(+)
MPPKSGPLATNTGPNAQNASPHNSVEWKRTLVLRAAPPLHRQLGRAADGPACACQRPENAILGIRRGRERPQARPHRGLVQAPECLPPRKHPPAKKCVTWARRGAGPTRASRARWPVREHCHMGATDADEHGVGDRLRVEARHEGVDKLGEAPLGEPGVALEDFGLIPGEDPAGQRPGARAPERDGAAGPRGLLSALGQDARLQGEGGRHAGVWEDALPDEAPQRRRAAG